MRIYCGAVAEIASPPRGLALLRQARGIALRAGAAECKPAALVISDVLYCSPQLHGLPEREEDAEAPLR